MVIGYLDGVKTWIIYRYVGDLEGIWHDDFRSVVISTESDHNTTDTRLLKSRHIDFYVRFTRYRPMVWSHILHGHLLVVVEDLPKASDVSSAIHCQLEEVEIFVMLIFTC